MSADTLLIEQLRLRVPGLRPDEAAELGQEVARLVAEGLPLGLPPVHLGELRLRVPAVVGSSRARLAELIAEAILEGLT